MLHCVICKERTEDPTHDYCDRCFNSSIEELDRKYGRASETREDHQEALASSPLTERTHR